MSPAPANFPENYPSAERRTLDPAPSTFGCFKTPGGVTSSIAASIVIALAPLRLRCWPFSLRPRSP
jgi:hypothetical protein